ncbi:spermatogenesis-associated protein 17 [Thrips palmi]|uniref:Spermatogenesis-associated protein 17 n=1 Tax=Thrips palmi TaxID=161013 RepID=A0A6P8ZII2_THRPL|nr:spermatogenesis-associated protein 17 [Thrips palmi]
MDPMHAADDIASLLHQIYQRAATTIQAAWRGHWARKKVFSYHIYVAWRARCLLRGHHLMQEMMDQRELLEKQDRSLAEYEAEKCSQVVLRKLHHLVSTKSTPGVFNSTRNPCARAVEDGLRKVRFRTLSTPHPENCTGLADQVRALEWEATQGQKLSVQRAVHLPKIWKSRLRSLQSIAT